MRDWIFDARVSLRSLRKSPAFTVMVVGTLALALGTNSAMFTMVNQLLIKGLPMQDQDSLMIVRLTNPERGVNRGYVSAPDLLELENQTSSFAQIGAMSWSRAVVTGNGEPVAIDIAAVSANLFDLWGTPPALGRPFAAGEDQVGADRVAILSHGSWQQRFAGDQEILGKTLVINGFETTIIAVAPREIELGNLSLIEAWVPLVLTASDQNREKRDLWVMARLQEGATLEQAQVEVHTLFEGLAKEHPSNRGWTAIVRPFRTDIAGPDFWMILTFLSMGVVLILVVACTNVATLVLARASARSHEIATRSALGAGRFRLLRQLLTENLILSLLAGSVGLLVTYAALFGLEVLSTGEPTYSGLRPDRNVLLFTAGVAFLAPLFFGLLPALRSTHANRRNPIISSTRSGISRGLGYRPLIVGQVAIALTLMVVAGLLAQSMRAAATLELGYDDRKIVTMRLDLPDGNYPEPHQQRLFFEQVNRAMQGVHELEASALVSRRPLADDFEAGSFMIRQKGVSEETHQPWAEEITVGPGYFRLMEMTLTRGRLFQEADRASARAVALVNEEAGRRYWGNLDPVGTEIQFSSSPQGDWVEVVGVVSNERIPDPRNPVFPMLYRPFDQDIRPGMALLAKPRTDRASATRAIRREINTIDPAQPVGDVRTVAQIRADDLGSVLVEVSIFSAFALFAMLMAAAGIYGLVALTVSQRTRELGLRMALGADAKTIRRLVLGSSLRLTAFGLVLGSGGAFAAGRVLGKGVSDIHATSFMPQVILTILLFSVAILAAWIPARRASRIDPAHSLRGE